MSYYIHSEIEKSPERTTVYQKHYENFVVIITQKRFIEKDDYATQQHSMLPKTFFIFIAVLPENLSTDSYEGSYFTSGGNIPLSKINQPLVACDIINLHVEIKKILYKYDGEMVPLLRKSTYCRSSLR